MDIFNYNGRCTGCYSTRVFPLCHLEFGREKALSAGEVFDEHRSVRVLSQLVNEYAKRFLFLFLFLTTAIH